MSAISLAGLTWRERAPMPLPRAGYIAGALGGRFVIAGGSYWENDRKHWSARTDFFDPEDNRWTPGPPLPAPRSDAACVVVGDALYVFGGGADGGITADALRLREGKWEPLAAPLRAPRLYPVAVAVDSTIYVMGGISKAGDYGSAESTMWSWDPGRRGAWKPMPSVPGPPRVTQAVASFGGKVYVFGGVTMESGSLRNLDDAWVFDPRAGTWSALPRLPVARRAWGAVPVASGILLLGGYSNDFAAEIYAFDPRSGALRPSGSLPHALADAKFMRVGNRLVTAGGESGHKVRGEWTLTAELEGWR